MSERFDVVRLRDFGKTHLVEFRPARNGRTTYCGLKFSGLFVGYSERPSDVCANCWRHQERLKRYGGVV